MIKFMSWAYFMAAEILNGGNHVPELLKHDLQLHPNELLNWIAKEVTRFAERKTRAIFVNQLTWC
jgi:hypothetical protein